MLPHCQRGQGTKRLRTCHAILKLTLSAEFFLSLCLTLISPLRPWVSSHLHLHLDILPKVTAHAENQQNKTTKRNPSHFSGIYSDPLLLGPFCCELSYHSSFSLVFILVLIHHTALYTHTLSLRLNCKLTKSRDFQHRTLPRVMQ